MARLTIAWVKEYAKTNGIFLVKTSNGYCVQYQRLIDELTYEDSVGYKEVFKTLKETKDWIDDQNPVDVLGIDKEVAKEIYEDAKNFSDKVDRDMGVDREEENYNIPELDPRYDGKFWNVESIGMSYQEDYTPLEWYEKLIKTGRDKHAEWWLNQHPEIKEEEEFTLTDDNKAIIQAIVELDPAGRRNWNHLARIAYNKLETWVSYPYDNCRDVYESAILVLNTLSAEDKARVKELVNNKTKEITFEEVKDFAENCGYELTESAVCGYCNFTLYSTNRVGEFTELVDIVETIKDGRLLNSEFCDLPLPIDLTYEEVKEFVFSAGYSKFNGRHNGFLLDLTPTKGKYLPTLVDVMDAVKTGELLRGEFCDLPLPKDCAKFIGMDENKLCFELEDGNREYLVRAIDLNYLKSHQSVIKDPNFTDLPRWANYTDLMGEVLARN